MADLYPIEAYDAIDHLNSWVRAPKEDGSSFYSPKFAIYDWKLELIKQAILHNIAKLEAITM